jgi:hypothetical protein
LFTKDKAFKEKFFPLVKQSQMRYRALLDSCLGGEPDCSFIDEILSNIRNLNLRTKRSSSTGEIKIIHESKGYPFSKYFEYDLDWEILQIIFDKHDEIFSRVKRCALSECGRYFLQPAKNRKYCSDACSKDSIRKYQKAYNQTEERKSYNRKYQRAYRQL